MESTGIVVAFWVLSALTIGAGLAVFLSRNLVHAIMFLILAFLGMAGLFVTLSADFIAVAQVLIYAGAISVLLVFAVMLTPLASRDNANSLYVVPGVLAGLALAAIVGFVAFEADWAALSGAAADQRASGATIEVIGDLLIGRYVLAFEIASILLLFALLGAIVLVHERTEPAVEVEPGAAGGELARESREPA
ncbi:MAG: NADH-quinone oxidoreductase subunit J [Dehalococcoidia bacterium]|nr:NADH-quinone oxidoreductase subunit J [Dehalococcoidia bacterium]